MEDEDSDFLPCSLGLIVHTSLLEAQKILKFIHQEAGGRIIFKLIAPKGEKLWIKRGEEP